MVKTVAIQKDTYIKMRQIDIELTKIQSKRTMPQIIDAMIKVGQDNALEKLTAEHELLKEIQKNLQSIGIEKTYNQVADAVWEHGWEEAFLRIKETESKPKQTVLAVQ